VLDPRKTPLSCPKRPSSRGRGRGLRAAALGILWCSIGWTASACVREKLDVRPSGETAVARAEPAPVPARPAASTAAPPRAPRKAEPVELRAPPAAAAIRLTPLGEEAAARHLARAWHDVLGRPASEAGLSTLWAHWAHETGRGARMMGNNFAGLKGHRSRGGARMWTREATGSRKELVRRRFRVYESPEQGAHDYVTLLLERYRGALSAARQGRTADFVAVLAAKGYYTDHVDVYQRALTLLARECAERSLARRALDADRAARPNQ
jgi:hypothetical protein